MRFKRDPDLNMRVPQRGPAPKRLAGGLCCAAPQQVLLAAGGAVRDPDWGDVLLLLNGSSTVTTDSSSYNRTLTNYLGLMSLDSGQQLFGLPTYEIESGVDSYIGIASDAFVATAFGSAEWCIEYLVRPAGHGASYRFAMFSQFQLRWQNTGNFSATCTNIGGSSIAVAQSDNAASSATWHHVAFVRDNTSDATFTLLRIYVNGDLKNTVGSIAKSSTIGTGAGFGQFIGASSIDMYGHATQMRMTVNTARYYANFTPPSAAFPTS